MAHMCRSTSGSVREGRACLFARPRLHRQLRQLRQHRRHLRARPRARLAPFAAAQVLPRVGSLVVGASIAMALALFLVLRPLLPPRSLQVCHYCCRRRRIGRCHRPADQLLHHHHLRVRDGHSLTRVGRGKGHGSACSRRHSLGFACREQHGISSLKLGLATGLESEVTRRGCRIVRAQLKGGMRRGWSQHDGCESSSYLITVAPR